MRKLLMSLLMAGSLIAAGVGPARRRRGVRRGCVRARRNGFRRVGCRRSGRFGAGCHRRIRPGRCRRTGLGRHRCVGCCRRFGTGRSRRADRAVLG